MNIFPRLLAVTAMISIVTTEASAYHLAPLNTKAKLKGILTFTPNEGANQKPFKCKVVFELKNNLGYAAIKRYRFPTNCPGANITGFPWGIIVNNKTSGSFGEVNFLSGEGSCSTDSNQFQIDDLGVWTLPTGSGQCLSGTLKSTPPITIKR